jgi:hypothetical protein
VIPVAGDFARELDDLELRRNPRHEDSFVIRMVGLANGTVGHVEQKSKCYTEEVDFLGSSRDPPLSARRFL